MTTNILAKNLKVLRKFRNLNQDQLANKLGVTRNKIASYETQHIEPRLDLLIKMARFFQLTVDDLISTPIDPKNYNTSRVLEMMIKEKPSPKVPSETRHSLHSRNKAIVERLKKENLQIYQMIDNLKSDTEQYENRLVRPTVNQRRILLTRLLELNQSIVFELEENL